MALTPAQIKAMHTGGVARVLRIRHGGYQVPGSQNGRVSTVLGTDLRALSGDCPAGRWGLDCSHRAAVAVRCAIEHACSIQSARGGATGGANGAAPGSARSTSPVPIAGRDREDAGARKGVVPRGSAAPASSGIPAVRRHA